MASRKKNIPQFNTTATADIAFIMLLFVLITGSLDPKTGIYWRLSPAASETAFRKKTDIEERDFITFSIDRNKNVFLGEEAIPVSEIRNTAKTFISNPDNWESLPRKKTIDIPILGPMEVAENHAIHLEVSRHADYQTYFSVLNELRAAYDELRNDLSLRKFQKPFAKIAEEQKVAVRTAYPVHISEKELWEKEAPNE